MFPSWKEFAVLINKYCTERGDGVYSLENHDYNKPETKLGVARALAPEKKDKNETDKTNFSTEAHSTPRYGQYLTHADTHIT